LNNTLSTTSLSAKTLKEIFHAAKFCQQVFVKQDTDNLEVSIDQLNKLVAQSLQQNCLLTRVTLNVVHNKFGYLTNLIVKTAVTTNWFAQKLEFNQDACASLTKTNLLILYTLTHPILRIKNEQRLLKKYHPYFKSAAQLTFKKVSRLGINDQNSIRLLSQLADINQFSKTNQTPQSICSLALNTAISLLPFTTEKKQTFDSSLKALHSKDSFMLQRPFTKNTLFKLRTLIIAECKTGSLVRLKNNKYGVFIESQSERQTNVLFVFQDNKINANATVEQIDNKDIALLIPQHSTDLFLIVSLFSKYQVELSSLISPAVIGSKIPLEKELMLPVEEIDNHILYAENNNNQLAAKLLENKKQSQLILDYASKNNRQKLPVKDISHAIALLGSARIFPTICDSQLNVLISHNRYLGSSEVSNKLNTFVAIAGFLSKQIKVDIPEYCQFIARLLFAALIAIPKSRYAITGKYSNAQAFSASLADLFASDVTKTWQKIALKLAENWRLPRNYQASLKAYFDYANHNVALKSLPRSSQQFVSLLELSVFIFHLLVSGQRNIPSVQNIKPGLQVLGLDLSSARTLYAELLDDVCIVSKLD